MLFRKSSGFHLSRELRRWGIPAAFLLAGSLPLHAETLKEALTAAYLYNPTLKAARAQLRATDNGVSQAKSGYRPSVSAIIQDGYENTRSKLVPTQASAGYIPLCAGGGLSCTQIGAVPLSTLSTSSLPNGPSTPKSAQIALQQNVFDGFRTYNNVKGAEAQVEAGREDLRNAEINVILNAATAYMNVVRDQAIVSLRRNNVRVLNEQLRATEDRFKVGEVTRTDVAQAQSGLAQSQADLSIAQGTLYGDQAQFGQYIGHPPSTLRDPGPPSKLLPKSLQNAIDIAELENPAVLSAIFHERAQQHQVKQLKAQLLPSLSLNASYSWAEQPMGAPTVGFEGDGRVYGQLNIPLYEAGSVSAQIRPGDRDIVPGTPEYRCAARDWRGRMSARNGA